MVEHINCSSLNPLELFNRRYEEELTAKEAAEERRKDELREQAQRDLQRWYDERQMKMEHRRDQMKNDDDLHRLQASEQSDKQYCDWTKLIQLIDLSPGTEYSRSKRDLTRMKTSIINAKRDRDLHASEMSN